MKKIFNLAVAMSVIASSLFFASCGEDDEEEEPKQEQNTPNNNDNQNNNQNENKPAGEAKTSITAVAGDSYSISNSKLGISGASLSIDAVSGTTVTVTVSGSKITIGSGESDSSYAIYVKDGGVTTASLKEIKDAKVDAANVLFICKGNSVLASGTEAKSEVINTKAGETTFVKQ